MVVVPFLRGKENIFLIWWTKQLRFTVLNNGSMKQDNHLIIWPWMHVLWVITMSTCNDVYIGITMYNMQICLYVGDVPLRKSIVMYSRRGKLNCISMHGIIVIASIDTMHWWFIFVTRQKGCAEWAVVNNVSQIQWVMCRVSCSHASIGKKNLPTTVIMQAIWKGIRSINWHISYYIHCTSP